MKLACIIASAPGEADQALRDVAETLLRQGRRPVGVIRAAEPDAGAHPCDMRLRVLPDGPTLDISQDLGAGATSCRLDPSGLETAAALTEAALRSHADMLILNKFGEQEIAGRGFRPLIGEALAAGVPVVTGVGRASLAGFEAFAGGMARRLPADAQAILAWALSDDAGSDAGADAEPGAGADLPAG